MNKAEKTALISAALASSLAIALITVAILVRSISMLAGGVISVARALTAVMLFSGMRLSRRHPDEFPTGLYKTGEPGGHGHRGHHPGERLRPGQGIHPRHRQQEQPGRG